MTSSGTSSVAISSKDLAKSSEKTPEESYDEEEDKYSGVAGNSELLPFHLKCPESHSLKSPSQQSDATTGATRFSHCIIQMPEEDNRVKKEQRPGMSLMSTISQRMINMYSSVTKLIWGEDYWVPTDSITIVPFPIDALRIYQRILPEDDDAARANFFSVVCRPDEESPIYHVTFTPKDSKGKQDTPTLSIFRSNDLQVASDLYQPCMLGIVLFAQLDPSNLNEISSLLRKFEHHPLWHAVHIAARMGNIDFFVEKQKEGEDKLKKLLSTMSHPEGLYPLIIAVQSNRVALVDKLLAMGADPSLTDVNGNNAMHFASLVSSQMLETLWKYETTHELMYRTNGNGCTPLSVAVTYGTPLCSSMLDHFGTALKARCRGNSLLFKAMQSYNTTISVIESLLKAYPDSLMDRDSLSGDSPLHVALFKEPLVALLQLRSSKLDINTVNFAGQSALHVNAYRENLGCMLSLAANGIDLDLQDNNGDTALHIVVSKSNVPITRALLCLGANMNVKNRHGDTPRHLATKLHTEARKELVRSLVICGAERCEIDKMGCRSECANALSRNGLGHSGSSAGTMSKGASTDSLGFDLIEVESTATLASIDEQFIEDLTGKEPAVKDAPTHEFRQQLCSNMVRKRAQESRKKGGEGENRMICLLALDGGGIRGLVTIQIMLALEKMLGDRVYDYFDWVAGTSTGSYLAGGLAQGRSLRECQHIYLRYKDTIFESNALPYNTEEVEKFIQEEVGAECTLADVPWPRLMISTVRCDVSPVELEFFRNYRLPLGEEENEKLGFSKPAEVKLWKALRCSSAAPTFFANVDGKYIDGGLIANNPALDLIAETHLWNSVLQYTDQPNTDQLTIGCLLSIGTGVIESQPMNMIDIDFSSIGVTSDGPINITPKLLSTLPAFLAAVKNFGGIVLDRVTATEGVPVSRSRSWCHSLGVPYFRLCAPLSKGVQLNTNDDAEIARMMWEAMEYTLARKKEIGELVELLRLLGKSEHRRHLFSEVETGSRNMKTQASMNFGRANDKPPSFTVGSPSSDSPLPYIPPI
uniref:phospholipase A2 n=1 Tax=Plectus sambesii TaxID=2011161 RepID=A0A914W036_9BILA